MGSDPRSYLTIGISSRALFDLNAENQIFEADGIEAYRRYQIEHEDDVLRPGAGFPLVKGILALNKPKRRQSEVVVMSRNNGDTALRIFKSISHWGLGIEKAALTSGTPLAKYLLAYNVDLFLSRSDEDVADAVNAGIAAGLIYDAPADLETQVDQIRIAFDGDAVLFSDEAQRVYDELGLDAFFQHEQEKARKPLPEGPFAKLLRVIAFLQRDADPGPAPIRTALVTSRNCPAHERVIRTLRAWNVRIDEIFFMGNLPKHEILKAFGAHIFFDDQAKHCETAATVVPTARVPYSTADLPSAKPPKREESVIPVPTLLDGSLSH